jgi:hypothetical protein
MMYRENLGRTAMRSLCAGTAGLVMTALVAVAASQNGTGSISGVLTDTTGRGLPGAAITAAADGAGPRTALTDAAGRYRLGRLPAGRYIMRASMSGFVSRMVETTVVAGQDRDWSGALLVGRVADERSIERRMMELTGHDAVDCGRHAAPASEAALRRSLACAAASVRERRPFSVIVQLTGGDPDGGRGLVAGSDGLTRLFEYQQGGAKFSSRECPSPDVKPSRPWSEAEFEFTCRTAAIPAAF